MPPGPPSPRESGRRRAFLLFVLLAGFAAILWLSLRHRAEVPRKASRSTAQEETTSEDFVAAAPHAELRASRAGEAGPEGPVVDRAKRDQMRSLIWQAITHAAPPDAGSPKKGAPYALLDRPPWPTGPAPKVDDGGAPVQPAGIDPKYIQERVRNDFFPLARKCYGDGLEQNEALAGKVVFAFNIVGDAKTGGIVEAVDVLKESSLQDPQVIDCMRQSFLSVTFPPPENGNEVTVVYPIVFSNDDGG